jgi:D-glycero-D-manno-heptose 1,7-bisphosphate phosphatase
MLYLFDLDNTLISGYMDTPNKNYHEWYILPNRVATIAKLRLCGNEVGIVTNQADIAFGYVTEQDWQRKIAQVCEQFWIDPTIVYVCFADARSSDPRYNDPRMVARRKPHGLMISEAIRGNPEQAALGVLYVGDRAEDQQAAHNANVSFQWSHIFFKD